MRRHALSTLAIICTATTILIGCGGESADPAAPDPTSAPDDASATKDMAPNYEVTQAIRDLYAAECETCHGATGLGDGQMAAMLSVKPRSFVNDEFKYVTDDMTHAQKIEKFIELIHEGIPAAMMPAYKDTISNEQAGALAELIFSMRADS